MPQFENVLPAGADTLLVITGLGGFRYQARDLAQTVSPIKDSVQLERTINGKLIDLSNPIFRKYSIKITCSDVNAPPLDGLFAGMEVTIDSAMQFSYLIGNPGSPFRQPVSGSEWSDGHFNYYRPIFDVRIMDVSDEFREWKSTNQWEITAEEI